MPSLTSYKGLQVLTPEPTGAGGLAIQNDFKQIVDWQPKSVWSQSADPTTSDDEGDDFYPGSQWLRTNTTPPKLFVCLSSAAGAAVWQPILLMNAIGSTVQAWDADLDAYAGVAVTGLLARTGAGSAAGRTLTGTTNEITVTNGNGVSGDPTFVLASIVDLTGKTLNVRDSTFSIKDNADLTKILQFQVSGVATGTTRTLTIQDASGTIYISGGTDVPVADGGTGASTAAGARENLGTPYLRAIVSFTASATYTKPAGLSHVIVKINGGGGGCAGSSGGGGQGGTTSFGSHCSASGGGGGNTFGFGGAGGTGSGGDRNIAGNAGGFGQTCGGMSPGGGGGGATFSPSQAGGIPGGGAGSDAATRGAGGGGGAAEKFILAASLGATETVTIGAGGLAGSGTGGAAGARGEAVVEEWGY